MSARVLVVDGDPWVQSGMARLCRSLGYAASVAGGAEEALQAARTGEFDVLLLDLELCGTAPLEACGDLSRPPAVVLLASFTDVGTAVRAMREGAADLIEKPVRREVLEACLARALDGRPTSGARERDPEQLPRSRPAPLLGSSEALERLRDQVARVARAERTTVLVLGESGTGKELVSRAIHELSSRRDGPFVALNCAALTEPLLEAELFGYAPGAFTGAARGGRDGLLAAAEGGTLLLDEVGELAPSLQAKLLRVLQERCYRPVGSQHDLPMDARVIASTHRDLCAMVRDGAFREDLFYRLNVLSIQVPALRERREDIPLLARAFLAEVAADQSRTELRFSEAGLEALCRRDWPGNVRELRNTVERAALLSPTGLVGAPQLEEPGAGSQGWLKPQPPPDPGQPGSLPAAGPDSLPLGDRSLKCVEEALIRRVMTETRGNRSRAARVLGVNRSTLYAKLRLYEIE